SLEQGPWGTHLDDSWTGQFDQELGSFRYLLSGIGFLLTRRQQPDSPVLERLLYAHRLIAEAYCEPHHRLRLVRLISSLEALALVGGKDKAHEVSMRAACAGGWSDPALACEIYDALRTAYHWRNAVVHGDAPSEGDVYRAFLGIER